MELKEALDVIAAKLATEARTPQEKRETEALMVIVKATLDSLGRIAVALEKAHP